MPRIAYEERRFIRTSKALIIQANVIIQEYRDQGFTLTLRQLYYQFVARGLLENTQRSYKNLGSIVSDARLAGLIDWNSIEDRTRRLESNGHWDSTGDIVEAVADQFTIDLWVGQEYRPEVWIEKDALVGVIAPVCKDLDVPYFACRGYVSQSAQWRAGRRLQEYRANGQKPIVFHLGDHDPSGIDMTRDNGDRLALFAQPMLTEPNWTAEGGVEIIRLALNMDQIEEHSPPPNPAKVTDSRFKGYVADFGAECWELDALEPAMIVQLIRDAVEGVTDPDPMAERASLQGTMRADLQAAAENWDDIMEEYGVRS